MPWASAVEATARPLPTAMNNATSARIRCARVPAAVMAIPPAGSKRRRSTIRDIGVTIQPVLEGDLRDLLPLLRGYCDFYRVHPPDERLLALSRALIERPE